jgi:ATP-dependent RNA helicase DeaD
VSLEFSRFLAYYKNAPDLNRTGAKQSHEAAAPAEESGKRGKGRAMARIVLNVGKGKKITKREIINMVASVPSAQNVEIGLIEIYKKASSVEVESKMAKMIVAELNGKSYKGLRIAAEENYEFTGAAADADRTWEPHHRTKSRRY